jgi:hypothetical protein
VSSGSRTDRPVAGGDDEFATPTGAAPGTPPTRAEHLAELKRLLAESVAIEAMLRDTVAGRRPPTSVPSTRATSEPPGTEKPRRRMRLALGGVAIAALVAANAIALVVHANDRSPRAAAARPSVVPPRAVAAASWASVELSHNAKVLADPALRARLRSDRFTQVTTPADSSSGTALTFDYIVSTPALRAQASTGNPIDRALRSSVPVALFGSGRDQVVVRQASTASAADIAARRVVDGETRRIAERQLLINPAVRARGPAGAALSAGQLDLRAATVLALMANASHIELLTVNVNEPERAAGLPARSIDVRADDGADMQATVNSLPPLYRPISDTQLPNSTHRMVWALDPEPPPALN